jgi:hypothetical protein
LDSITVILHFLESCWQCLQSPSFQRGKGLVDLAEPSKSCILLEEINHIR